jgi:hypothetical protein
MSENTRPTADHPGYMVAFDSDRIKDYVFATGRLKEIRGASMRVTKLTDEDAVSQLARGGEVIYADGAAGMVGFDDQALADEFCRELEKQYRLGTISGTLSAVCVEWAGSFSNTRKRAMAALRRVKEDRRERYQLVDSPFMRFCDSCRRYPVETTYDERFLCQSCVEKRRAFDESARRGGDRLLIDDPLGVGAAVVERMGGETWARATFPADLTQLGAVSRPANYLAFVYCDGNRMGDHIHRMPDAEAYTSFSKDVSDSLRKATVSALSDCFPQPQPVGDRRQIAPFEVLLIGGDDLIVVSAADRAVELILAVCRRFQAETRAHGHEVSMSGGVVFAHVSQPILSLEMRSQELLRQAKDRALKERAAAPDGKVEVGAIDFLVTSSPTLNPLHQIRREDYWRSHEKAWRTQRPYTLDELTALVGHVRRFKSGDGAEVFPRNKLNALYQALFKSKDQATFETMVVTWHLSRAQRQKLLDFAADLGFRDQLPWGHDETENTYSTALADLIELYDFVPAQRPEGGEHGAD